MASGKKSLVGRLLQRLTVSEDEEQAEQLRREAQEAGAQRVGECALRTHVHLRGTLNVVTLNPRGSHRWLEAELIDGSGTVTLVWMGRRVVPGIEAGRRVDVDGFLTLSEGRRVIYNPRYALLPS